MEIKRIVPSICKSVKDENGNVTSEAKYEGFIEMRAPSYDEVMDIQESCQIDVEEGESKDEARARLIKKNSSVAFIRKVAAFVPQFVQKVEIKRLEDGFVFDSFDMLKYDTDMFAVITELATRLVGKHQVGKSAPKD